MVETSLSGSGEGLGRATDRGYSTAAQSIQRPRMLASVYSGHHLPGRAGLHLGSTTVRRMLSEAGRSNRPAAHQTVTGRHVTSRCPNDVWSCDLTTVPTMLGFWVPWFPFALPQIWPFCWWVAVAIDHFSRRVVGTATFKKEPTSAAVQSFPTRTIKAAGTVPHHLITDSGVQCLPREAWPRLPDL